MARILVTFQLVMWISATTLCLVGINEASLRSYCHEEEKSFMQFCLLLGIYYVL